MQEGTLVSLGSAPRLSDVLQGLRAPLVAWSLIRRTPKLWRLTLVCFAVTAAALSAMTIALATRTDDLLGWLWTKPDTWYGRPVWYLTAIFLFLALFLVLANTVPLLLLAPLQDPLSEATEEALGAPAGRPFSFAGLVRETVLSLSYTLRRLGVLVLGLAVLFPLNAVPGIGSTLWTGLAWLWSVFWVSVEYIGGPMVRHRYPFDAVWGMARRRRWLCLGFGSAVAVLLWIPVVQFFFVPVAIVAGTVLFRSLQQAGALPVPRV